MAYSGYLISVGTYVIPMTYINEKSYKCTYSVMDLDSYRDANGVLHRNAVLKVPHCSFETRPLKNADVASLWSNISSQYTSAAERRVLATVYLPETDGYYTGSFYIPDTNITINTINHGNIQYEPITFEFIGYGE